MTPEVIIAALPVGAGVVVASYNGVLWAMEQKARIDRHDQQFELIEKRADERHEETKDWLKRIEAKL